MVTVEERAGLVDAEVVEEWSGDVAPVSLDPMLEAILLARDYEASHVTRGGQGKIRRLRNTVREVDCAVKTALESEVGDVEFRRLQREAAILRRLTLPGVVEYVGYEVKEVVDKFNIPDREIDLYTRWVDGDTLERVRDAHDITPEKIRDYRDQFLDTLGQLHQRGILHRDIKPMNVVKTLDEKLVLLDLGLAKREGDLSLTGSKGTFIGTYNYTALELREGKKATAASDLYAVGVTLVELLRGKEFSGVVDAADVRLDLAEYGRRLDTDVRESLEAMLVDDPVQRMEKFRLGEGRYVFGEEESLNNTTLETVADEGLKTRSNFDNLFAGFGGLLGFGFTGLSTHVSILYLLQRMPSPSTVFLTAITAGALSALVCGYYDSAKAKWKNWRENKRNKDCIIEDGIIDNLQLESPQPDGTRAKSIDDVVDVDKEESNTTSITESPTVKKRSFKKTNVFFSSLIGGGYGTAGGAIIGGIYDIYKGQFGAPEINPTDETSLMITLIGATSGIIIGGSWDYIREKWNSKERTINSLEQKKEHYFPYIGTLDGDEGDIAPEKAIKLIGAGLGKLMYRKRHPFLKEMEKITSKSGRLLKLEEIALKELRTEQCVTYLPALEAIANKRAEDKKISMLARQMIESYYAEGDFRRTSSYEDSKRKELNRERISQIRLETSFGYSPSAIWYERLESLEKLAGKPDTNPTPLLIRDLQKIVQYDNDHRIRDLALQLVTGYQQQKGGIVLPESTETGLEIKPQRHL